MQDQIPLVDRVRRNHALEHATMHILSQANARLRLMGRSDWTGFWLYGKVDTDALASAADEAARRLSSGEAWLAVHPRCGTNLTAPALVGGLGGYLVGKLLRRWPLLQFVGVAAVTATALSAARSVGLAAQRHVTTDAQIADLEIVALEQGQLGDLESHHVITRHPARQRRHRGATWLTIDAP